jgi:hypothetical protein
MDTLALNYNMDAVVEDNSCYFEYDVLGCSDSLALNFDTETTYDDALFFLSFSAATSKNSFFFSRAAT